jgi:predicted KAP-like P-loop ATPase
MRPIIWHTSSLPTMKTKVRPKFQEQQWLSADRPIAGRADDKLGRSGFADAIASAIRGWHGRDSLVIALYGSWGTGKSSIKNMIVETVGGMADPSLVTEFNPWQFANREQMTAAFFDQIGIGLARETGGSRKDRDVLLWRWQRYATYLAASRNLVELLRKMLLWIFAIAGASLLGAAALNEANLLIIPALVCLALGASLGLFADAAETVLTYLRLGSDRGRKSIDEFKKELAQAFQQLPHPVLIVMDDVDCLTPLEMQEVFQLIKANADFPNFVYLLLFERAVVEDNICKVLGVPGHDYIEKIVQVGFDLPAIEQPRLNRVLFDGLNRLLAEQSVVQHFNQQRWGNLFVTGLQPYFHNLRQVNRFLSNLATHIALFQAKEVLEVNVVDLIGLEVLRVFEPEVYRALASSKDPLTRTRVWDTAAREERARSILLGVVDMAPPERRERVREIIRQLFPPAEWAFGGARYGAEREEGWYQEFRVCAGDLFDRYFHFAIPESDLSQETIEGLLAAAGDRTRLRAELRSLNAQGLLAVAMERLEEYKDKGLDPIKPFVTALFDIGDELPEKKGGLFEITPAMGAMRLLDLLLQRQKDPAQSLETLRSAIEQSEGLSLPVWYIAAQEQKGPETTISPKDLAELKQICVTKIRFAAAAGRLAAKPGLRMILYWWKDWSAPPEAKDFCRELLRTRQGAATLVKAFLQRYTSQGLGKHGARERWYVKLSEIEQFVPCELIEQTLRDVPLETLPMLEQRAVQAFQQAVDRRQHGRADLAPTLTFRPGDIGNSVSASTVWNFLGPRSVEA